MKSVLHTHVSLDTSIDSLGRISSTASVPVSSSASSLSWVTFSSSFSSLSRVPLSTVDFSAITFNFVASAIVSASGSSSTSRIDSTNTTLLSSFSSS
ncbi:hypothetical protein F0562_003746 [Nyssa sinensis]|uniref:Uncharacterized protein n=1 Tax=Nyssa sinensis TaxID=561372 RepID=A0A5J5BZP3_9ASTE|nr:hypothetical protein F0562_003746 [Nyssa sinensis]